MTTKSIEGQRRPLRADVSPELWKRVKIRAVEEELSLRDYLISAIERDLDAKEATEVEEKQNK